MKAARSCAQCGKVFEPRREHARFCSAECRVRWNREHLTDAAAEQRALEWSLAGMQDVTERLALCRPEEDGVVAFSAVAEAVWWVTIIDARLIRQYMDIYEAVLAAHDPAQRSMVEGTLSGLRYVRNQTTSETISAEFISPPAGAKGYGVPAAWGWNHIAEPPLDDLPEDVRSWELTRYQEYEAWLAGNVVGDVFQRATGFLDLAVARAASVASALTFIH
jgi:hypothetical protein